MDNYTWRILLVDDDEDEYLLTREMLAAARTVNFTLEWANSYAAGLRALRSDDYDAALVDYHLANRAGVDLIHAVTSAGCATPIILVTGLGSYELDMQAMQAGAADYLNKSELTPSLLERSIRYTILHKQAERALLDANTALRESEELFHIAFENAPVMVFTQDSDLRYTWVYNPHFGFLAEAMLGRRDDQLPGVTHTEQLMELKRQALVGSERVQREVTLRVNGEQRAFVLTLEPFSDHTRQSLRGSAVDITRLRQLEAQQLEQSTRMEVQRHLLEHREMERQVIARNLHDGPVQELIGLVFNIQSAIQLTPPGDAHMLLEAVRQHAKDLTTELRSVCNELRPPSMLKLGLEFAIRSYADFFQNQHPGITLRLDLHSSGLVLEDRTRLALYRIFQEALNNVLRHSGARQVSIHLILNPAQALLEIQDDGCGFTLPIDWTELARSGHFGLVGMKERAEAVGAELHIQAQPGQGTLLRISAPTLFDRSPTSEE